MEGKSKGSHDGIWHDPSLHPGECYRSWAAPALTGQLPGGADLNSSLSRCAEPLPEGAIGRLGTSQFWLPEGAQALLAYTDELILVAGHTSTFAFDAQGGAIVQTWPRDRFQALEGQPYLVLDHIVRFDRPGGAVDVDFRAGTALSATLTSYVPRAFADQRGTTLLLSLGPGNALPVPWLPSPQGISAATVSPDGRLLAVSWTWQGLTTVYDLSQGRALFSLRGTGLSAFSPDGSRLATVAFCGNRISVTSVPSGAPIHRGLFLARPCELTFSPAADVLAVREVIGGVHLFRPDKPTLHLPGVRTHISLDSEAARAFGTTASAPATPVIGRWSVTTGELLSGYALPEVPGFHQSVDVLSHNGLGDLAVFSTHASSGLLLSLDDRIWFVDPLRGCLLDAPVLQVGTPRHFQLSPNGNALALATEGRLFILEVQRSQEKLALRPLVHRDLSEISDLSWSPDGRQLLVSGEATLQLFDRSLVPQAEVPTSCDHACWADRGHFALTCSPSGELRWRSPQTLEVLGETDLNRSITTLALSETGELLATDDGGTVLLWDLLTKGIGARRAGREGRLEE